MGKFRRMIGFAGMMAGGLVAGEQAAPAQQPRIPERGITQTEKAPFSPKSGFEQLLKQFDTNSSKSSMSALNERIANSEKRVKEYLTSAKGNEDDALVKGEKGHLEATQDAYEIMKRVDLELRLQEKYKAAKDAQTLEDLQRNASSLNFRYIGTKNTVDSAKRIYDIVKKYADEYDKAFVGALNGGVFLDEVRSFVQEMRGYYGTTSVLDRIDREVPGIR